MNRILPYFCVAVAFLFSGWYIFAQASNSGNPNPQSGNLPINPNQVAILHWYAANQTTEFTAGAGSEGLAFDGANMWVANFNDNTVTELKASDGSLIRTVPAGTAPFALAFDGANIWVSELQRQQRNQVARQRRSAAGNIQRRIVPGRHCL